MIRLSQDESRYLHIDEIEFLCPNCGSKESVYETPADGTVVKDTYECLDCGAHLEVTHSITVDIDAKIKS